MTLRPRSKTKLVADTLQIISDNPGINVSKLTTLGRISMKNLGAYLDILKRENIIIEKNITVKNAPPRRKFSLSEEGIVICRMFNNHIELFPWVEEI